MGELLAAWRALAGDSSSDGWRTIAVMQGGPCRLLAGRHFPGNEEALLVGFGSVRVPPSSQLPQSRGFVVSQADLGRHGAGRSWIALSRQNAGSLDLFATIVLDVASTLNSVGGSEDDRLFHVFLGRIRAWQDFMRRSGDDVLSSEAEVGLFGELEVLRELCVAGLPSSLSVEAWKGPLDGIHDFALGTGAVEVKTTVSPAGFDATIGSLEQLDDSLIRPIFLACIRLALDSAGRTLPEQVRDLRDLLRDQPAALANFNSCLLHAGFFEAAADRYSRRFSRVLGRVLPVSASFPRLTRANVPIEIRGARYQIDIDLIAADGLEFSQALQQLGVI